MLAQNKNVKVPKKGFKGHTEEDSVEEMINRVNKHGTIIIFSLFGYQLALDFKNRHLSRVYSTLQDK